MHFRFPFIIESYLNPYLLPGIIYYFSALLGISIMLLLFLHLRIVRLCFLKGYWIIVFNHALFEEYLLRHFLLTKFCSVIQWIRQVFAHIVLLFLNCSCLLLIFRLFLGIAQWFIAQAQTLGLLFFFWVRLHGYYGQIG